MLIDTLFLGEHNLSIIVQTVADSRVVERSQACSKPRHSRHSSANFNVIVCCLSYAFHLLFCHKWSCWFLSLELFPILSCLPLIYIRLYGLESILLFEDRTVTLMTYIVLFTDHIFFYICINFIINLSKSS